MTTLREAALAAHIALVDGLVAGARAALLPVVTGPDGPVLDPVAGTEVALVDVPAGLVVLTVTDGSEVAFGVYPSTEAVQLVSHVDGQWTRVGTAVCDLASLGAALVEGVVT